MRRDATAVEVGIELGHQTGVLASEHVEGKVGQDDALTVDLRLARTSAPARLLHAW